MRGYKKVLVLILTVFLLLVLLFRGEKKSNAKVENYEDVLVKEDAITREPFEFLSGNTNFDEVYKLAMSEVEDNIRDGTFIAGDFWSQMWTRDSSYAIELAAGLLHKKTAESTIRKCTETDKDFGKVWLQDECGHFGGWPHLTDAIVGAQGAWSLFVITGNKKFLSWAYSITKNSLKRAERDVYDANSGLFTGCSSFMESNSGYPDKYRHDGDMVGSTKALSTNILYYNGYKLGEKMGKILEAPDSKISELGTKAELLREAIRSRLWNSDAGYYSYFEDENEELIEQMEGLGESLALLAPEFETNAARIESIFANTYRSELGIPSLWPRFTRNNSKEDIANYYHNGRIWPFVQGYWAQAASRHGQVDIFHEEFKKLLQLAQMNSTFAEFYELSGTFPSIRRRQLWSASGYLSMVYHGLFGMEFLPDGIRFNPVKPSDTFSDVISLSNVHYRDMILNIEVSGAGKEISSFSVDGKSQDSFLDASLTGVHDIQIELKQ